MGGTCEMDVKTGLGIGSMYVLGGMLKQEWV